MHRTRNKTGMTKSRRATQLNTTLRSGGTTADQGTRRESQKDGGKVTRSQGLSAYYIVRGELVTLAPGAFPKLIRRGNLRWEEVNKLIIPLDTLIEHYALELRSENKSPKTVDWYCANLRAFAHWLKRHRHSILLGDLIRQLAGDGMGSKAIAARLKGELDIAVSYKTIQRILSGQRVSVNAITKPGEKGES